MGPHQRVIVQIQLRHVDFVEQEIAQLDDEVSSRIRAVEEALQQVDAIPGIGRPIGEEILNKPRVDISRFPTDAHPAWWALVCPGNKESVGRRKSGATVRGNPWLRATLLQAAWA